MRAADTLSVVFPQAVACGENITGPREIPDHPLVFETIRDCLVEALDAEGLVELCGKLERGEIEVLARDTVEPSPLSHELINANPYAFLDDAPLEERRTRAVQLRRGLPATATVGADVAAIGALDPAAIAAAASEVAPLMRDADEVHDALLALWLMPEAMLVDDPTRLGDLAALAATGRACRVTWADGADVRAAWVATERLAAVDAILGENIVKEPPLTAPAWTSAPARDVAIAKLVAAHLDHRGPICGRALAELLGVPRFDVVSALLALEGDGAILRGHFTSGVAGRPATARGALAAVGDDDLDRLGELEWCNRRVLARIHRLTLAKLRREIEPVSAAALMRFLLRWQRVARHTQVIGADGLFRVLEQLQGFETAAGAWEREILPARMHGYDLSWLDQLCLAGQVAWCRLSPRRGEATDSRDDARGKASDGAAEPGEVTQVGDAGSRPQRRSAPSRSAPLSLLLRKDLAWLRAAAAIGTVDPPVLSPAAAQVRDHLVHAGASFLADLVAAIATDAEASIGDAAGVVEDALWELVGTGLATADGFASLRVLVDRRRGEVRSHFDRGAITTAPPGRKWQEAIKRARTRDRGRPGHALRALPTAAGRWSLLPAVQSVHLDAEASARQLLLRYGVVFRDLVTREASLPPWRDVVVALRRLEARGEIRGGRFVTGFVGEQFALPEALDELRAVREPAAVPEACRVAAADPLNLVGILSPGPRVPAIVGNAVLYVDGHPVASLEAGEVVTRAALPQGARVDDDLTYHPPPRPAVAPPQVALPL
jgi:ATP-dependent Lhr-like helicase